MTRLFAPAIFLGAFLLFVVQPMVGKMLLPVLGGAPAVWNTCLVFFQSLLLVGYAYAMWVTRRPRGVQVGVHLLVLLAPAIALPVMVLNAGSSPSVPWDELSKHPTAGTLLLLARIIGLPALVLTTSAPLLQRWYSLTNARDAHDPYWLYAASNAGSLLGLLSYPLLIEPNLTLFDQSRLWSAGYAVYGVLTLLCGLVVLKSVVSSPSASREPSAQAEGLGVLAKPVQPLRLRGGLSSDRIRWILLSLVPAALSIGTTQFISTDVAAVPLLWVAPLAVYLLTFVIAFSKRNPVSPALAGWVFIGAALALAPAFAIESYRQPAVLVTLSLLTLAAAGLMCHTQLARERPGTNRLAEYYLLSSLGGAVGGILCAIVAPMVFSGVYEYPLAIVAACLLRPLFRSDSRPIRLATLALPALLVGSVLLAVQMSISYDGRVLGRVRTFFGVHTVSENAARTQRSLWHGTTKHGVQSLVPGHELEPQSYYHPSGPIGHVFRTFQGLNDPRMTRVSIVGMGAGSLASYAREGDEFMFYEIDPEVVRIASDGGWFKYVSRAKGRVGTRLGDGRLTLTDTRDASFGLIILDAFSSDAVPVHLLTKEAFATYLQKLTPGGLIAIHISNRNLDLMPVLAAVARELNLYAIEWLDKNVTAEQNATGKGPSQWVVLSADIEGLKPLAQPETWRALPPAPKFQAWTDDSSNILGVLR